MKTFAITDTGKARTSNQDYIYSNELSVGNLENLFIVADGMGGHLAGDIASRIAAETIVDFAGKSKSEKPIEILRTAVEAANERVANEASANLELADMGTTVVAATIADRQLYLANVGDSRLYILNDGIEQITKDHSLVDEMVRAGSISKEEARFHPKKNIITRAVGSKEGVLVDMFQVSLEPGDLILLCTDGLTNMVEDDDIFILIKQQRDIAGMAQTLVDAANAGGGKDNISLILIDPFSEEVQTC